MTRTLDILILLALLLIETMVFAGGVKGTVINAQGEELPFATIYVHQIQSGSSTNQNGYFEIPLAPGAYDIVFQYMGYETVTKHLEITDGFKNITVVLNEKTIQLQSATVYGGKEDPAYTLMRKAIAKAPFHLNELDSYSAEVYMKGSGRVINAPFFIRKQLAESGLDSNTAFISETVTEVQYTRPNIYKQNVISTRTSGSDNNTAQNGFVFGSFYSPNIGGIVSPLSPKAFTYYRFKYLESFSDRGYTINKIQVIPRSKGEGVVEGYLYLVENDWNIYRMNFVTYQEGLKIGVQGMYAPVEEKIWLPVNLNFNIYGKIFGVEFEYKYLAVIGKYKWVKNPDLDFPVEIVDEKRDKELAKQLEKLDQEMDLQEVKKGEGNSAKVTRKQLRKLLDEYEKEESEELVEKDVVRDYSFTIDSMANKKDSTYWEIIRPVPLDSNEINGYHKLDSIMVENAEKEKNDSIKASTFSPTDLFLGYTYRWNDTNSMYIKIPGGFNTVDGFLMGLELRYTHKIDTNRNFQVFGETHYAFSRVTWLGQFGFRYEYGDGIHRGNIQIYGGKMDVQLNSMQPVTSTTNMFTSLFLEDNYMKLYQNEFIRGDWNQAVSSKITIGLSAGYTYRTQLKNNSDYTLINYKDKAYSSNRPENQQYDVVSRDFNTSERAVIKGTIIAKPWQKIAIRNGKSRLESNSSPEFSLALEYGNSLDNSSVGYSDMEVGFSYYLRVAGGRRWRINSKVGLRQFHGSESDVDFIDYKHFMGNESPFVFPNPAQQFRMLSYYGSSTMGGYANVFTNYEFRRLLLTQIFYVKMLGLKENLFVNYLWTDYDQRNYVEMGYSLDNIFRIFRVEVATNNVDKPFTNWVVRFGVTTNFAFN